MNKVISLGIVLLCILALFSCNRHPEIDVGLIQKTLIGKTVGSNIFDAWTFQADEPKTINVIDDKYEGDKASITIDIDTKELNKKGAIINRRKGRLRLHYEWLGNEWNLISIDNISFKEP